MKQFLNACKAVLVAKRERKKCHKNHTGGTNYPGKLALNICPELLSVTSKNVNSILITGTSGKSTTVRMITSMLQGSGNRIFSNYEGANMIEGITTCFALNSKPFNLSPKSIGIIECDELYVSKILDKINPSVIVLLNLFSDQVTRLQSAERVRDALKKAIDTYCEKYDVKICVNSDNDLAISVVNNLPPEKLVLFHYDENTREMVIGDKNFPADFSFPGVQYMIDAAAATAAVTTAGLYSDKVLERLGNTQLPFGRMERIRIEQTDVILNLIKNPTDSTFALEYLKSEKMKGHEYAIVLSNTDKDDIEWMKDIPFNRYRDCIPEISLHELCITHLGEHLQNDVFHPQVLDTTETLLNYIVSSSEKKFYLLFDYFSMMEFRSYLASKGYVENFGEKV